jgi:hypothetical protein
VLFGISPDLFGKDNGTVHEYVLEASQQVIMGKRELDPLITAANTTIWTKEG